MIQLILGDENAPGPGTAQIPAPTRYTNAFGYSGRYDPADRLRDIGTLPPHVRAAWDEVAKAHPHVAKHVHDIELADDNYLENASVRNTKFAPELPVITVQKGSADSYGKKEDWVDILRHELAHVAQNMNDPGLTQYDTKKPWTERYQEHQAENIQNASRETRMTPGLQEATRLIRTDTFFNSLPSLRKYDPKKKKQQ
jgi:hypothetical protein